MSLSRTRATDFFGSRQLHPPDGRNYSCEIPNAQVIVLSVAVPVNLRDGL